MSLTRDDLLAAVELVEKNKSFVIGVHTRPDPDTVGSALALARALRARGKEVTLISQDPIPENCDYLPDAERFVQKADERSFDVAVFCDAGEPSRMGASASVLTLGKNRLVVDHHVSTSASNTENTVFLVDHSAAATAEIVFELIHELKVNFEIEMAEQLMAGLVGDTGGFRFANVTSRTLEIASRLVEYGASPAIAARQIYENRSVASMRIVGSVLSSAVIEEDIAIIWGQITRADFERLGATDSDTEGIVNQLSFTKGIEVAILFRETRVDLIQISFRSRGKTDVNAIARAFGGGGHVAASGATVEGSLEDTKTAVLAEVRRWMAS